MPIFTTTLYNKGKAQSGTSIQKTLKEDATTYFAKVAIGNSGTGSLVTADGASKGVTALLSPADGIGTGAYLFVFPEQKQWLGAPSVVCVNANGDTDGGVGQLYSPSVSVTPSIQLSSSFTLDIVGIGDEPVAIVRVVTYQHSGSVAATGSIPSPTNLPSGSSLLLSIVGTKSPVF